MLPMDDAEHAVEPTPSTATFPPDTDTTILDGHLVRSAPNHVIAVALIVASIVAPFLKGLIAGLALAGVAAAVGDALGAGRP